MSKRTNHVIALAGAAALAGFGYTFARRSGSRSARISSNSPRRADVRAKPTPSVATDPAPWQEQESERISYAPDVLDLALDLDGVFDGKSSNDVEVTARPHEHVPAPSSGDDEDAPAPDDLGSAWLRHATESERSLGTADTLPEVENLRRPSQDLSADDAGENEDETTAEYIRQHRISSVG